MPSNDDLHGYKYKLIKKQLKLIRGLTSAPPEQRERLGKLLESLEKKTGLSGEAELTSDLDSLKNLRDASEHAEESISNEMALRYWFLRPLLSHLDHPGKLKGLTDPDIGIPGLAGKVQLHIPVEENQPAPDLEALHQFFSFKGMGKGSGGSEGLQREFMKLVKTSNKLPFDVQAITDLPMLHYNVDKLCSELQDTGSEQHVSVVSGLCPLSLMSDELTLIYKNGISFRPELGFEPLEASAEKGSKINAEHSGPISKLQFPPRPIFNDYLELLRVFTTANKLAEIYGKNHVGVKLWLPIHEYYLAITHDIFPKSILEGLLDSHTIEHGMLQLMNRYKKLVETAATDADYKGKLMLNITNSTNYDNQLAELETLLGLELEEIVNQYVPSVYGLYKGTPERRKLYALLALKHLQPLLEDINMHVLHIENSYELWPSLLASLWAEKWAGRAENSRGDPPQIFSWLCMPSIPSPSLKYMRALNAPYDHKLYMAVPGEQIDYQLSKLHYRYVKLISVLLPGTNPALSEAELKKKLSLRIHKLQKILF